MRTVLRTISISLITLFAVAFGTPARAVLINFDAPADGTVIDTYYYIPFTTSVSFSNPVGPGSVYARASIFNTSPGNVVSVLPTGLPPFNASVGAVDGTVTPVLLDQVLTVTVMAAAVATIEPLGTPNNKPFMQAFDGSNNLLGTVYFQGSLPTNPLEVTSFERLTFSVPPCVGTPIQCAGYGIHKVRFSSQQGQPGPPIYALFDDFQWNPPVCSAPVIPNGDGSACAGTINTDSCAAWTCDAGFTAQGSDPVCNNGSWTGTFSCVASPVSAMSPYYVADGDASRMFIVSPAAVATPVTTYAQAYPLAVRRSVMLGHLYDSGAREYTLSGLATGVTSIGSGLFGQLLDGTTDGVQWNYAVECCGFPNSIVRANLDWRSSTALFDLPASGSGIAYDTRRNHLFVSFLGDLQIREYDLAGALLNTFSVAGGPGPLVGLAYEQSTDTLWGKTRTGGTLYQFDKLGALLDTVPVAGLTPSNDFGGEMRIRPMIDFQSLEHADGTTTNHGPSYSEDGFALTGFALTSFGTLAFKYTGSTALFSNLGDGVVELRRSNGARFDMVSIDLGELNGNDASSITFTGDRPDGGTVTQSFTLDGSAFGVETFGFGPEFRDLTAVRWTQQGPYHQFDNIVAEERIWPIIDFQSLEHVDAVTSYIGPSYSEDGFAVAGGQLGSFGTLESRYTGSTALFDDVPEGEIVLTRSGGGAFDLISIDLAELNGNDVSSITFTGDRATGGTVTQTFSVDGSAFAAETFEFSGDFRNLTAVRWTQQSPYHQFDNIVVPEPASFALIFAGTLGVLAAHAHRGARGSRQALSARPAR